MSKFKQAAKRVAKPEPWLDDEPAPQKEEKQVSKGNGTPVKALTNEERADAFKTKGNRRLTSTIRAIRSLRTLSSQRFNMYSNEQLEKIKGAISKELDQTIVHLEQRGLKARAPIDNVL